MPRLTSRDLRNESRFEVLHAVFALGPSTRQEIARYTGLSTATVATLVTQFLAEGVLRIAAVVRNAVGRPYERLTIDPDRGRIVGVDVAETYVSATVYDISLGPLGENQLALDVHQNGPMHMFDVIAQVTDEAVAASGADPTRIIGAGVSMPSQVQPDVGVLALALNFVRHEGSIEAHLQRRLGMPVYIDNPLKAIAMSEMWFGIRRKTTSMAVVNLGAGVGVGIAINGWLLRGATNTAGEWGHTLLELDGRQCRCGRMGCVEAYLGVQGIETTLADIDSDHILLRKPQPHAFVDAVADGLAGEDAALIELAHRTSRYLSASLGDLVNLLDISNITLTGPTTKALAEWLVPAVRDQLPDHVLLRSRSGLTVDAARVPGNPVALGMAAFTLEQFLGTVGMAGPA